VIKAAVCITELPSDILCNKGLLDFLFNKLYIRGWFHGPRQLINAFLLLKQQIKTDDFAINGLVRLVYRRTCSVNDNQVRLGTIQVNEFRPSRVCCRCISTSYVAINEQVSS
jgi:hypothetical protein